MFSYKFSKLYLKNFHSLNTIWTCSSNYSTSNFENVYKFASNIQEGLRVAKLKSKPLMLIVHKTFCGACRTLIPRLIASAEVKKLSPNFIMVNVIDGNDSKVMQYAPDGGYVPRIVFIRSDGMILTEVTNPSIESDEFKYYYQRAEHVVRAMKRALELNDYKK